jgi:hypothetical protein
LNSSHKWFHNKRRGPPGLKLSFLQTDSGTAEAVPFQNYL